MVVLEKEIKVKSVKREKDSEGKEKLIAITLENAADVNFINSQELIVSESSVNIRKN